MYDRISVYVVAHQDDWQLFMDPSISADIVDSRCKTVIIYTTAGDAGYSKKYWIARELGAVDSVLFRISNGLSAGITSRNITVNNKSIYQLNIGHCSMYFLRLPDGGMYGNGFPKYDYQSISKIRLLEIGEIRTVDLKNVFKSFKEISCLINEVITSEHKDNKIEHAGNTMLNFPEYDNSISPNDHNDHLNTSLLIKDMEIYKLAKKRAFVHYHIQHKAVELKGTDLFWKVGMFSVYHQTVLNKHGHSTISETPEYSIWCRKNVLYREIS